MKKGMGYLVIFIAIFAALQLGMARKGQYDEEARRLEREERAMRKTQAKSGHPIKEFASGVKQATVDSTTGFISDTAESTREEPPVVGTLEGARVGSGTVLDNAVKGVVKVATLGYGEVDEYEVIEPEKGSNEPTKIRIKIPGT